MDENQNANDNRIKTPISGLASLGQSLIQESDYAIEIAKPIESAKVSIVPDICDPQEDYNAIFQEFAIGSTIRERAFYRIWRLRQTGGWNQIVGINGELYNTWEDFIRDVASNDTLSIGRQVIFDRMKVYDQLEWLGYSQQDIISKMAARPSLYTRVLKRVVDWDTTGKVPNQVMLPVSDADDMDKIKDSLNELINDVESFPRQIDALRYVDENILLTPRVEVYMQDDIIIVSFTETAIDESGQRVVIDSGFINFHPDSPVPDWLLPIINTIIATK